MIQIYEVEPLILHFLCEYDQDFAIFQLQLKQPYDMHHLLSLYLYKKKLLIIILLIYYLIFIKFKYLDSVGEDNKPKYKEDVKIRQIDD